MRDEDARSGPRIGNLKHHLHSSWHGWADLSLASSLFSTQPPAALYTHQYYSRVEVPQILRGPREFADEQRLSMLDRDWYYSVTQPFYIERPGARNETGRLFKRLTTIELETFPIRTLSR